MSADTNRENVDRYSGDDARKAWSVDDDLYPSELEIIERHFPARPLRVLDIGCGAGRTTIGLERRGFDVEAIDISEDLVDEAAKRLQHSKVSTMDARTLAYPDASFDAVMFSFNGLDCVHPSRERLRVLDEVHRVLRPNGIFYYSGHNGLATWGPRPGDSMRKWLARNRDMVLAQRRSFSERMRYLAYPEIGGSQVLYSALPITHFRELREHGFALVAVYGSRRYRAGLTEGTTEDPTSIRNAMLLARITLTCPHVHYVGKKIAG